MPFRALWGVSVLSYDRALPLERRAIRHLQLWYAPAKNPDVPSPPLNVAFCVVSHAQDSAASVPLAFLRIRRRAPRVRTGPDMAHQAFVSKGREKIPGRERHQQKGEQRDTKQNRNQMTNPFKRETSTLSLCSLIGGNAIISPKSFQRKLASFVYYPTVLPLSRCEHAVTLRA